MPKIGILKIVNSKYKNEDEILDKKNTEGKAFSKSFSKLFAF